MAGNEWVILPPITYGYSHEHAGISSVTVHPCTFLNYLLDVIRSALRNCCAVVVVNGHGGNRELVMVAARLINSEMGSVSVIPITVWDFIRVKDHAGPSEASVYTTLTSINVDAECGEGDPRLMGFIPTNLLSRSGVVGCGEPLERDRVIRGVEEAKKFVATILKNYSRCQPYRYQL